MRVQKLVTIIALAVTFSVFAPVNALDAQDTDKQLVSKADHQNHTIVRK